MLAWDEPVLRDEDEVMLNFMGFHIPQDGYGHGTMQIAQALRRIDSGVEIIDMAQDGTWGTPENRAWEVAGAAVALCLPEWYGNIRCEGLIGYTMFEATKLPAGWTEAINRYCERLLVPCQWNREVFRDNGVECPIDLAPWGISPDEFWPIERNDLTPDPSPTRRGEMRPYTFLWSGTPDLRKGWDVAYRAFCAAFGRREDVQLILNFREALPGWPRFADRNVRAVIGKVDLYKWRGMLAGADVFVFPSRGEGWGLPPREAAATGMPTLATNYGGLAEEIEQWGMPIEIEGMSRAEYGWWDDIGEWAEPSVEHTAALMRWCFEHQDEARAMGMRAAAWLRECATWERTAESVLHAASEGVR